MNKLTRKQLYDMKLKDLLKLMDYYTIEKKKIIGELIARGEH
jgi:hypothetical protein